LHHGRKFFETAAVAMLDKRTYESLHIHFRVSVWYIAVILTNQLKLTKLFSWIMSFLSHFP